MVKHETDFENIMTTCTDIYIPKNGWDKTSNQDRQIRKS